MTMKDLPDYTREMVLKYTGGFIGLEELAARLGSIVPWDLKGNIVLIEDFESEETEWAELSNTPDSYRVRSSRHKYSADWALKLHSALGDNDTAYTWRNFAFPGLSKYAYLSRFCLNQYCRDIGSSMTIYIPPAGFAARVDYHYQTGLLTIETTDAADHTVDSNLDISAEDFVWHPFMLTFDLETGYYDKLIFAQAEYDISDIPLRSLSWTTVSYINLDLFAYGASGNAFDVYFDDIIIAKNVP